MTGYIEALYEGCYRFMKSNDDYCKQLKAFRKSCKRWVNLGGGKKEKQKKELMNIQVDQRRWFVMSTLLFNIYIKEVVKNGTERSAAGEIWR